VDDDDIVIKEKKNDDSSDTAASQVNHRQQNSDFALPRAAGAVNNGMGPTLMFRLCYAHDVRQFIRL